MPKVDFRNLTKSGDFEAAARSIRSRGTALKNDTQYALLCGLKHMDTCGDYTSSINPLLDAIKEAFGKNLHVAAMEWVIAYSWLVYDEGEKKLRKDPNKVMKLADAALKMWYATERPAKAVPFDAQKAVTTLFDKFKAEVEAGRGDMTMFTGIILKKLTEQNPDLVTDLFADLSVERKNETLAIMVAQMTPANVEVEAEVETPVAAAA